MSLNSYTTQLNIIKRIKPKVLFKSTISNITSGMDAARAFGIQGSILKRSKDFCYFSSLKSKTHLHKVIKRRNINSDHAKTINKVAIKKQTQVARGLLLCKPRLLHKLTKILAKIQIFVCFKCSLLADQLFQMTHFFSSIHRDTTNDHTVSHTKHHE